MSLFKSRSPTISEVLEVEPERWHRTRDDSSYVLRFPPQSWWGRYSSTSDLSFRHIDTRLISWRELYPPQKGWIFYLYTYDVYLDKVPLMNRVTDQPFKSHKIINNLDYGHIHIVPSRSSYISFSFCYLYTRYPPTFIIVISPLRILCDGVDSLLRTVVDTTQHNYRPWKLH